MAKLVEATGLKLVEATRPGSTPGGLTITSWVRSPHPALKQGESNAPILVF